MVPNVEKEGSEEMKARPFWPGFALEELSVLLLFAGLILMLASIFHPSQFFEPGLGDVELKRLESPANPFNTPPRILPEWYFLAVFELLKVMPPWVVFILIGLFALAFILTPFIQKFLSRFKAEDWILRLTVVIILALFLFLTAKGMGVV